MIEYADIAAPYARIAYDTYFADELIDADAISRYIADCSANDLSDALDLDISDLLHNANSEMLFPATMPFDFDALESLLLINLDFYDAFIAALARIIES